MIEGVEYNPQTIMNSGFSGSITMTNNSSYSIYCEYLYGDLRKKYNIAGKILNISKQIQSLKTSGKLSIGSKLTFIDLTNTVPSVYYYNVTSDNVNVTSIDYSSFKDMNGNAYTDHDVAALPDQGTLLVNKDTEYTTMDSTKKLNVGVEKFLILVDNSQVLDQTDEVYNVSKNPNKTDKTILDNMYLIYDNYLKIKLIGGLSISFNKGSGVTSYSGSISKETNLDVKAEFNIDASSFYWNYKNTGILDSNNRNKYLELAFYFKDSNGNRILLPEGTNVKIGATGELQGIKNSSVVYYYKDSNFSMPINNIDSKMTYDAELQMDFSVADMNMINTGSFELCVDLLRTAEKDYPMGSSTLDFVEFTGIQATASKDMGFSESVSDLNQLGINRYNNNTQSSIDFSNVIDFSRLLQASNYDYNAQTLADKRYTFTYQLYKKVKATDGTISYQLYDVETESSDILISANNNALEQGIEYEADITKENILENHNGKIGIVSNSLKIIVPPDVDFTNYKLVVILNVYPSESSTVLEITTQDYFIFNVSKIKNEL